ncbi:hypothetical protein C3747_70g192 [Trypanosoma cruzi]|uniref:Telomere length regulation protein conserved domain-containing protein n=2 Tax=Trypanosoma cruzi TaxID=5693 RepID=Q4CNR0_TRYCC|nr:hypothetical protein, conserved [Trypanosoma cruzi]EAN81911.1 hypothetical protein, conserved [Trypanosoma cruzi]PWV10281.1 hypothetical protein C3747_70g192 [Trypanosoma cruzi]RNC61182.1 hypothetical protein TcCL_ESM01194 [Trypanosoma cruzi]|eukprot:XP_803357.1 hypothetical protein [Trypanosoma cruzi strain CL Brener]
MLSLQEACLYEGAKNALAKVTRISLPGGREKPFGEKPEQALEGLIDMLGLDAQPEAIVCKSESELIEVSSSTPLLMFLCEFAMNLRNEEPSPMELQVLRTRCTFVASLPDRVANALLSTFGSAKTLETDLDLLATRICQSLCRFLFVIHEAPPSKMVHATSTMRRYKFKKENALLVCEVLIQNLVRRGFIRTLFQCFVSSLKAALPFLASLEEIVPRVFGTVYRCCFKNGEVPRASMRNIVTVNLHTNTHWSEWNTWFLRVAERDPGLRPILISSLIKMINIPDKNEEAATEALAMSRALMKELFVTETSYLPTERSLLRVIFREVLPGIVSHSSERGEVPISEMEMGLFAEAFQRWSTRDLIEKGSVELNTTLANSILYILLHIKEYHVKDTKGHLPGALLQPLLAGISLRFELVRAESLKTEAITVASVFATFFVGNDEARNAFSSLEQFPSLLNDWLKGEADSTTISEMSPITPIGTHRGGNNKVDPFFLRRSIDDEEYPLDPDAAFMFFCRRDAGTMKKTGTLATGGTVVFNLDTIVNHGHLPSFGKTRNEQDELEESVTVLVTLRESYNAIIGVGRSSNAQVHEVQQAVESGLRGFFHALNKLKEKLGIWKEQKVHGEVRRLREKVGMELNPMIPSLLPALMSLTIHAPESRHKELMDLRYSVIVSLVIIAPENALSQLGKMLYSSHYGIFQRVEMAKALAEAAKYLSQVEVRVEPEEGGGAAASQKHDIWKEKLTNRRIYPPIREGNAKPMSIIVSEGRETRRWGSAVAGRVDRKERIYCSLLTNVVPFFVSALLEKAENDHFSFLSEYDPYVPTEILRSIGTVVQCMASARHIAPALCEKLMSFAILAAIEHPLSVVRKQGWILIGEIMRCWCGAGPLVLEDGSSFTSRGVFGGSLSYVFSQEWLDAQRALGTLFVKTKDDPSCAEIALLVLADIQDLVMAKKDLEAMESRVVNTKKITMTADTNSNVRVA